MPAVDEVNVRDRLMTYTGISTNAGNTPIGDSQDPTAGVPTRFFVNKRRSVVRILITPKTGGPCRVDFIYNTKTVFSVDVPPNTVQAPQQIEGTFEIPLFMCIGIEDQPIYHVCSIANGATVNVNFFDEN